ncbi:hypothetical protein BX600DRAFT_388806 [Xylariales sp. PMI_506]|nr:hypothetical protein BX600DRAFT_388806 [Xylariales sp. PMI_506]
MKVCNALGWLPAFFYSLAAAQANSTNGFQVGAARVDITPPPNPNWLPLNEYELEKLHVRAIVFTNNGESGALLAVEAADLDDDIFLSAQKRVADILNTTISNIIVSYTHTHGASPGGSSLLVSPHWGNADLYHYSSLADAAADAVNQALTRLTPAMVGYSTGQAYNNVNRDYLNPLTGRWTQDGNLTGPVDREVEVLTFVAANMTPIAVYTSYSMHPSASGDVNPLYRRTGTNNLASLGRVPITGLFVPQEPIEEPIRDSYVPIDLDHRPDPVWTRRLFDELTAQGTMIGEEVIRVMSLTSGWDDNPSIWSAQTNATCPGRTRLDSAREGVPGVYTDGPEVNIRTGALALGDIVIATVGAEIFTRIGWRIKSESPMPNRTMLVTMANGRASSGYIPDALSWDHETFQVLGSKLMPGSCPEVNISSSIAGLIQQYQDSR